ncbi:MULTISPECIES: DUF2935 domain-containing protein [unclassified Sedimentibacter]|uniref:DUF2935 domain-containing protein n=1 Tax=unclassified Sedimentibacter TaxID=2649220 RepID=UPI0027E20373|nr:DUF2935 domain-containing protein [Sedimentibacter sp. MB35-C1]WMJ77305.1 DUF2935 domain-containing protein [Sedimentibacter sp. MB35-C1]
MSLNIDFVRKSLELHLFFARIMKEHSFFLQLGFTPRDSMYTQEANMFRREFDDLLSEVILLSDGVVSSGVLHSGEVVTPYTMDAEKASSFYTGVNIPVELTMQEYELTSNYNRVTNPYLEDRVHNVNRKAIVLISKLIQFKSEILSNVLSCKMFTVNYPLLIDHIMREAKLYLHMVQRLNNREIINLENEALEQEAFWNRIMAEHSKFIRGLLDPTEEELFKTANNFGNEFDNLTTESLAAMNRTIPLDKVTKDSLQATQAIRDFKAQGTEGLLDCKIKSIIIPLLGDHTLREANHFLRLLASYEKNV